MKKRSSMIRGLAAVLCCCILCSAAFAGERVFPDVSEDADYYEAVEALVKVGIILGDDKGNFNPDQTLTRAEAAAIFCRLIGKADRGEEVTETPFDDVPVTHWAAGYIVTAVKEGLVDGYGNGRFGPGDELSYEQIVTLLVRVLGYRDAAEHIGSWPEGYLLVAQRLGITEGVAQGNASRATVCQMVFNVLKTDLLSREGN